MIFVNDLIALEFSDRSDSKVASFNPFLCRKKVCSLRVLGV